MAYDREWYCPAFPCIGRYILNILKPLLFNIDFCAIDMPDIHEDKDKYFIFSNHVMIHHQRDPFPIFAQLVTICYHNAETGVVYGWFSRVRVGYEMLPVAPIKS
jgi:hypothetical protein